MTKRFSRINLTGMWMKTNSRLALNFLCLLLCVDCWGAPLIGIGVALANEKGRVVIKQVVPGSPAELSGEIHEGDEVVAVGDVGAEPRQIKGMALAEIVKLVRGAKDTEVQLTVLPAGQTETKPKTVRLIRSELKETLPVATKNGNRINQPAPDIVGEDVDGKEFRLSDYRGKVVMVDFWGDW